MVSVLCLGISDIGEIHSWLGTNIHTEELAGDSSLHIVILMKAMAGIRACPELFDDQYHEIP